MHALTLTWTKSKWQNVQPNQSCVSNFRCKHSYLRRGRNSGFKPAPRHLSRDGHSPGDVQPARPLDLLLQQEHLEGGLRSAKHPTKRLPRQVCGQGRELGSIQHLWRRSSKKGPTKLAPPGRFPGLGCPSAQKHSSSPPVDT